LMLARSLSGATASTRTTLEMGADRAIPRQLKRRYILRIRRQADARRSRP
jgi:hypothetical protein